MAGTLRPNGCPPLFWHAAKAVEVARGIIQGREVDSTDIPTWEGIGGIRLPLALPVDPNVFTDPSFIPRTLLTDFWDFADVTRSYPEDSVDESNSNNK